jgi:hypothetical protein
MRAVEKRLRERIKYLETNQAEIDADRELFRKHFARRFRWWIELLGKGTTPSLPWLIEQDAKEMRDMKWWSW